MTGPVIPRKRDNTGRSRKNEFRLFNVRMDTDKKIPWRSPNAAYVHVIPCQTPIATMFTSTASTSPGLPRSRRPIRSGVKR